MNYKGYEIDDHKDVLVEETPYKEYYNNYVEFTLDDLEELVNDYKEKENALKNDGVEFRDLKINFHGTSYYYNPNGPDEDANMEVYFSYYRPETEEERDDRILNKMNWIDSEILRDEWAKDYEKRSKKADIEKAKKLLEENGYSVK